MNKKLKEIYVADIKDSSRNVNDWNDPKIVNEIKERDKKRRRFVKQLIREGQLKDALDYHRAALIFQHGEISKDFTTAHELAKKAVELGDDTARWLYAATLDRWLISIGKPQKFGTQFKKNKKGGWELGQPIDKSTTDEERKKYHVPPLSEGLKKFKEKYKLK
jgi:hypothetical protein